MREIELSQGQTTTVDDEDFEKVNRFKWSLLCQSPRTRYAFRNVRVSGRRITTLRLHRFILNLEPGDPDVDHVDGNGLNNVKANLQLATHQQNQCNQRKQLRKTSSRFKGVTWDRHAGEWKAQIKVKGKNHYLGCFAIEQEAAEAYDQAAVQFHNNFAKLNCAILSS